MVTYAHMYVYAPCDVKYLCVVLHLKELDKGVPVQQRVRAMMELRDIVATKRLEEVCGLNNVTDTGHHWFFVFHLISLVFFSMPLNPFG